MSNLLKRDKQAFEEYTIQDAFITLKHALYMERFNLGIKKKQKTRNSTNPLSHRDKNLCMKNEEQTLIKTYLTQFLVIA